MKELYLFRHAEAENKSHPKSDFDRELTPRGVKESLQMGVFLAQKKIYPDKIFCSSSARTKQTLNLACHEIRFESYKIIYEDRLYDASTETFLELIKGLDKELNKVMFVGHNPSITHVMKFLTNTHIKEMSTAGIAIISFEIDSWSKINRGSGRLAHYADPTTLENIK